MYICIHFLKMIQKLYKEMELKIILINGFCFLKKEIQANLWFCNNWEMEF